MCNCSKMELDFEKYSKLSGTIYIGEMQDVNAIPADKRIGVTLDFQGMFGTTFQRG